MHNSGGTLWEFLRNRSLNAANFFSAVDASGKKIKAPLVQNQFGFVFGGPVAKNRTFFFGSYEGALQRQGVTYTTKVPTAAERGGDLAAYAALTRKTIRDPLTGQPFSGNVIPSTRIDPISVAVMNAFLSVEPNSTTDPLRNYVVAPSSKNDTHSYLLRGDHKLTDNHQLMGRWSMNDTQTFLPGSGVSGVPKAGDTLGENRYQNAMVGWSSVLTPRLLNDLRVGYTRVKELSHASPDAIGPGAASLGLKAPLVRATAPNGGRPTFDLRGNTSFINLLAVPVPLFSVLNTYQLLDNLTLIRGKHTLKLGIDLQRHMAQGQNDSFGNVTFDGAFSGDSFSDFLLGVPRSIGTRLDIPSTSDVRNFWGGMYVQDDWRVAPRLTLNLGVRYEVEQPIREIHGFPAQFDPALGNGVGGFRFPLQAKALGQVQDFFTRIRPDLPYGFLDSESIYEADKNNWGPRVGLAFRPFNTTRTVIRSGFGVYYYFATLLRVARFIGEIPPHIQTVSLQSDPTRPTLNWNSAAVQTGSLENSLQGVRFGTNAPVGGQNLNPYTMQWSYSLSQELTSDLVATAEYVGSRTNHATTLRDIQNVPPGPGNILSRVPFSKWGQIRGRYYGASATYHAMLLSLERRLPRRGLSFKNAYTWSKALSWGGGWNDGGDGADNQNFANLRVEKGHTGDDLRHRFTNYTIWDLPFGRGQRFGSGLNGPLGHILGGWQVSGIVTVRSGFPFKVNTNRALCNAALTNLCLPDRIGGPDDYTLGGNGVNQPKYRRENFPSPNFAFGNIGFYPLRQNGLWNLDTAVLKSVTLLDDRRVEFRFEGFNFFNNPRFLSLSGRVDNANFARAFSSDAPRVLQFGLKLYF